MFLAHRINIRITNTNILKKIKQEKRLLIPRMTINEEIEA